MVTVKRLNIQDKPGYFFSDIVNINSINPDLLINNDFTITKDGSILFDISYCEEGNTPHIIFNDIECIFRKSGLFSYLIFCESEKNAEMLNKYIEVIDQIKEEILSMI